jgi:solute carrier family 25 carnitine/acylcarnitine transporter 20/29
MDFVCGCIGGFTGTILSHPIDTIKTRIQSNYTFMSAIKKGKLYSGIQSPLFGIPLEKSIVFGCCEYAKKYDVGSFASGFIAGFISTVIVTPIEYIKINAQNSTKICFKTNVLKLYRGITPTICRESLGYGVYFATYDNLSKYYNLEKSLLKSFLFGGITGLTSWLVIYPADLVKTIMQNEGNVKTVKNIIMDIYKKERIMGFYKGMHLALMRSIPLHAGVFGGYELSKNILIN